MRSFAGCFIALVVLSACQDANQPNTASLAGQWRFGEVLTDVLHGITCTSTGTYTIEQNGEAFTGSYTQTGECVDRNGDRRDNPGHGPLTEGRIRGLSIRFAIPPTCEYDGLATTDRLSGNGLCELSDGEQTYRYFGAWEAVR